MSARSGRLARGCKGSSRLRAVEATVAVGHPTVGIKGISLLCSFLFWDCQRQEALQQGLEEPLLCEGRLGHHGSDSSEGLQLSGQILGREEASRLSQLLQPLCGSCFCIWPFMPKMHSKWKDCLKWLSPLKSQIYLNDECNIGGFIRKQECFSFSSVLLTNQQRPPPFPTHPLHSMGS